MRYTNLNRDKKEDKLSGSKIQLKCRLEYFAFVFILD